MDARAGSDDENRERQLDELLAIGAIYPEEFRAEDPRVAAYVAGEADTPPAQADVPRLAFELDCTLPDESAGGSAALGTLALRCTMAPGYPAAAAAEISGTLTRAHKCDQPWKDHEALAQLLKALCEERAGEEAVCEVAAAAVEWAAERCAAGAAAAAAAAEPEPKESPAPGEGTAASGANLSKYKRTKLREAREKKAAAVELAAQRAEVEEMKAEQLAAAAALGLPESAYGYEVMWADGGWSKVAAPEVLVRLRPPLDRTVADSFVAMPPMAEYEVGSKVSTGGNTGSRGAPRGCFSETVARACRCAAYTTASGSRRRSARASKLVAVAVAVAAGAVAVVRRRRRGTQRRECRVATPRTRSGGKSCSGRGRRRTGKARSSCMPTPVGLGNLTEDMVPGAL